MANAPDKYIDNIKIGSSDGTEIAASHIITKVDEHGAPIPTPKFLGYYDIKPDCAYSYTISGDTSYTINFDDNWGKSTPSVTCVNTDGEIIFGEVKYNFTHNPKQIEITFSEVVNGTVYIN